MILEDQTRVLEFLSSPAAYGGAGVERVETHASIVFLTGSLAYKLKRAVRFDYLDFSTVARRRELCEAELRLNRRTAPTLYRRVVAVTEEPDGSLSIGGGGAPVEPLVEMNRFSQEALLDRLAARGELPLTLMPALGSTIAAFHATAEPRRDHGGRGGIAWVIDGNAAEFDGQVGRLDRAIADHVITRSRLQLERHATLLERRREEGLVRQCHGDLHLRNIVLLDGRPTLFDGVEFNERISCTDVLYDLAFLVMDLWRRRLPGHANAVLNRYLREAGGWNGLALLPLFLSCRAAVRAKTSATAAAMQSEEGRREEHEAAAREYLAMAERLLRPAAPTLVAIGGLSGSGKSTLALGLAPLAGPVPGAVLLRSDEIRKHLGGVAATDRLGPEGYRPRMTGRVYERMAELAAAAIGAGHSVIVDAVHVDERARRAIERVADQASVPFVGLWLEAPASVLVARTEARRGDASDADVRVVRMQQAQDPGVITWSRLDAAAEPDAVIARALGRLEAQVPGALDGAADRG